MRGHIRKRGKTSWAIVLPVGRDPITGKKKYRWIKGGRTKKEAESKLAEVIHQMETGMFIEPSKMTVADYLKQWLSDYASTNVRPRTHERYTGIVERHLIPAVGQIKLVELRPAHIQAMYSKSLNAGRLDGKPGGLSARTVLQHHRILSEALSHAVKWNLVARNVANAIDPPRPQRKEMTALDTQDVVRLLKATEGTIHNAIFHLAVYTGLRRSEILALAWKNVDLDLVTLSVVRVMHQLPGGRVAFDEPKTAKGRRLVDLSPDTALLLRSHKRQQASLREELGDHLSEEDLVFSHPDGSHVLPATVSQAFRRIANRLGLPTQRFHDLRHTHASLLLKGGYHPKIVQERLGHASIMTTLDTYSHVTQGLQALAARGFADMLRGEDQPQEVELPAPVSAD